MIKKKIIFTIAAVLLAGLLTSCGNINQPNPDLTPVPFEIIVDKEQEDAPPEVIIEKEKTAATYDTGLEIYMVKNIKDISEWDNANLDLLETEGEPLFEIKTVENYYVNCNPDYYPYGAAYYVDVPGMSDNMGRFYFGRNGIEGEVLSSMRIAEIDMDNPIGLLITKGDEKILTCMFNNDTDDEIPLDAQVIISFFDEQVMLSGAYGSLDFSEILRPYLYDEIYVNEQTLRTQYDELTQQEKLGKLLYAADEVHVGIGSREKIQLSDIEVQNLYDSLNMASYLSRTKYALQQDDYPNKIILVYLELGNEVYEFAIHEGYEWLTVDGCGKSKLYLQDAIFYAPVFAKELMDMPQFAFTLLEEIDNIEKMELVQGGNVLATVEDRAILDQIENHFDGARPNTFSKLHGSQYVLRMYSDGEVYSVYQDNNLEKGVLFDAFQYELTKEFVDLVNSAFGMTVIG